MPDGCGSGVSKVAPGTFAAGGAWGEVTRGGLQSKEAREWRAETRHCPARGSEWGWLSRAPPAGPGCSDSSSQLISNPQSGMAAGLTAGVCSLSALGSFVFLGSHYSARVTPTYSSDSLLPPPLAEGSSFICSLFKSVNRHFRELLAGWLLA